MELQSPCCSSSSFVSFEQVLGEKFADQLAAAVDVDHLVTSERARLLTTFAPAGVEEFFVTHGVPVIAGEPPPAPVEPDPDELAPIVERYAFEIVGPPLALP